MVLKEDYPPLQALLFWQTLALFWFCGLLAAQFPLMGFALALVFIYIDSRLWRLPALVAAAVLFCLGIVAINSTMPKRPVAPPAWTMANNGVPLKVRITGKVRAVQALPDQRLRIILEDVHALNKAQNQALEGLVVWTWDQLQQADEVSTVPLVRPLRGQSVQITARVRTTEGFLNPWAGDIGAYWQRQGVFWRIWSQGHKGEPKILGKGSTLAELREEVRQKLYAVLASLKDYNEQAVAFIPALLMYERFHLQQATLEKMQAVSLMHSLALSGQHLVFILYYAIIIAFLLRYFFPYLLLYIPSSRLVGLFSLPLALVYLWLGNAPMSLIRASIMLFVGMFFYFRLRVVTLSQILLCTVLCITIYHPLSFYDIGLQLSVLCVASICYMMPFLQRIAHSMKDTIKIPRPWYIRFSKYLWRRVVQLFLFSLGIQLALLPIFLTYFQVSGLWFFSNVIWLPILGLWVLPLSVLGLCLTMLSFTNMASSLFSLAVLPCEGLLAVLNFMSNIDLLTFSAVLRPHWINALAWLTLCLALALLPGRVPWKDIWQGRAKIPLIIRRLCIIGACLLCVGPILRYVSHWQSTVELRLLDVGQGQSVYLGLPGGRALLVDGGGSRSLRFDPGTDIVLPHIVYNRSPRLWAMFSTHADIDHQRGLLHLLSHLPIKYFFHNGEKFSSYAQKIWDSFIKTNASLHVKVLHQGDEILLPSYVNGKYSYALEVLWPPADLQVKEGNNASLVLRLVQKEQGKTVKGLALLCGDAEKETLQALLNGGQDISAEVLVVPHHGARNSYLPKFYERVNPQLALVSAGRQNSFGHPHKLVRTAFERADIPLKNTAQFGAIRVVWQEEVGTFTVIPTRQ